MAEAAAVRGDRSLADDERHRFRQVLGRFASGVTIVTAKCDGEVRGMTASAFMSGSLVPPLVVISIGRSANLHDLIARSGAFGISILGEDQEAHSRHFAGQPGLAPDRLFEEHGDFPLVAGALAGLVAEVEDTHACGDHSLFVGRVRHLQARDGEPLLHFLGGYRRFADGTG
ncbi:MAG: flavin reductase [Alphaproteobacteria bacterium]|nr:flavin reductase [Alphaproteobacteria bacterium]